MLLTVSLAAHHDVQVPVRWMALESIVERVYTPASDVWSYGVLCWEVLTHGQRPYDNVSSEGVVAAIRRGHRLSKPSGCPEDM